MAAWIFWEGKSIKKRAYLALKAARVEFVFFSDSFQLGSSKKLDKAAERITAQRRNARKQFKQDRARAISEANEQAEAAFAAGQEADSATFLNAPQRPSEKITFANDSGLDVEEEDSLVEDIEHLQLTLQEAFFLCWSLRCLSIFERDAVCVDISYPPLNFDSQKIEPIPSHLLWTKLLSLSGPLRPDNPFIIHYIVYHHFRSLGWVIRGGLKFCVDYLLYKKGPVFSHAE